MFCVFAGVGRETELLGLLLDPVLHDHHHAAARAGRRAGGRVCERMAAGSRPAGIIVDILGMSVPPPEPSSQEWKILPTRQRNRAAEFEPATACKWCGGFTPNS